MMIIWRRDKNWWSIYSLIKKDRFSLIGNPDAPDSTSTDHEYFPIHDNLFDKILSPNQNVGISVIIIPKDVSQPIMNEISKKLWNNTRKNAENLLPYHTQDKKETENC